MRAHVEKFLKSNIYVILCGSVRKGDDPHGRIVHDYNYETLGAQSINAALLENSAKYIEFREKVRALSQVHWSIVVALNSGYRQLLQLNPKDWGTQIYS